MMSKLLTSQSTKMASNHTPIFLYQIENLHTFLVGKLLGNCVQMLSHLEHRTFPKGWDLVNFCFCIHCGAHLQYIIFYILNNNKPLEILEKHTSDILAGAASSPCASHYYLIWQLVCIWVISCCQEFAVVFVNHRNHLLHKFHQNSFSDISVIPTLFSKTCIIWQL